MFEDEITTGQKDKDEIIIIDSSSCDSRSVVPSSRHPSRSVFQYRSLSIIGSLLCGWIFSLAARLVSILIKGARMDSVMGLCKALVRNRFNTLTWKTIDMSLILGGRRENNIYRWSSYHRGSSAF